mgnify:CR=1 FL=1
MNQTDIFKTHDKCGTPECCGECPTADVTVDYRLPEHRREVFFAAYEFHLRYKGMPGFVYGYFPELAKRLYWTQEDKLWFAFLNGCTQNPSTTMTIFERFPSIADLDIDEFNEWYFSITNSGKMVWQALIIDMDRRHFRNKIGLAIKAYQDNLNGMSQVEFFKQFTNTGDKFKNFRQLWNAVFKGKGINSKFYSFGRLSSFSYIEYLWIMGLDIDCDSFFSEDYKGSSSHRNGMCKVLGRDDLDEHRTNPLFEKKVTILHTKEVIAMLDDEMEKLYEEAKFRFALDTDIIGDVSRFTIESQLCNYKSWFRKSRRYPNVYVDMGYDRLMKSEAQPEFDTDMQIFWDIRKDLLPAELRAESDYGNVGVSSYKQNLYRTTGRVHTLGLVDSRFEDVPKDK